MGIRETLNQNPAITTGATAAVIVLALAFIVWQLMGSDGQGEIQTEAWFTIDDGQNWFADDINKIPPFEKDGKQAYKCYVFTCDGGKTKFVSHLERYTPDAKKKLEEQRTKGPDADPMIMEQVMMSGIEVKAPKTGDKGWVKQMDERAMRVTEPKCPDGTINNLEPVLP